MAGAGITSGKRRNRVAWISAVLAGVALAAAGCSSASSSSTGSTAAAAGTGSASTSCPNGCELTVVTPNLDPSSAITIYLADDLGYFTKYGVNVNRINGVAAGSVPLLTSGKADLIDEGSTAAFKARQIQEVADDPLKARRFVADDREIARGGRPVELHLGHGQRFEIPAHRCDRRRQLV